jgi:hypothetical protein
MKKQARDQTVSAVAASMPPGGRSAPADARAGRCAAIRDPDFHRVERRRQVFARKRFFANALPEPDLKYNRGDAHSARRLWRHMIEGLLAGTGASKRPGRSGERRIDAEGRRSIRRKCRRSSARGNRRTTLATAYALRAPRVGRPEVATASLRSFGASGGFAG